MQRKEFEEWSTVTPLGILMTIRIWRYTGYLFCLSLCYFCNIYDLHGNFFFCWLASAAYLPSTVPARLAEFFNCVPFRTDIADFLGCLYSYENLIVAKMSATGHNVTVSDGHNGSSA